MTQVRCNSCGATWAKPKPQDVIVPHVCPDQIIDQHAVCDPATGNTVKPATFKPVQNPRNENPKPNPERPNEFVMVSEGNGITELE